jgi:hypothetical protein
MWPHVEKAVAFIDSLRHERMTDEYKTPEKRAFYGLVPESISHEGYSAKPMHSYWDDFWALAGYESAIHIARALEQKAEMHAFIESRDQFRRDLYVSLGLAMQTHGIDYLPGAAELGDFDPTSSTIAIAPAGELHRLPSPLVLSTFERYWQEFVDRRDGRKTWEDYTPYELRTVGTFVRLGWRERAHDLLTFFMDGRRPPGWNQWPEVIGRDNRPRFVGDLPHGWIASDFIRSALDLFAYEREADGALVLAGGIPPSWLDGSGIAVQRLRTPYGPLSYSLKRDGAGVVLQVADGLRVPPGGLVFVWEGSELRVRELPARIVIKGRP